MNRYLFLAFLLLSPCFLFAQALDKDHTAGDEFYAKANYGLAKKEYQKSADRGYGPSLYQIGVIFLYIPAERNIEKGVLYLRAAAEKSGVVGELAMLELALFYTNGKHVPKDIENAKYWNRQAADLGSTKGIRQLGSIYYDAKNYGLAYSWFEKSANFGDDYSIDMLWYMCLNGFPDVPVNFVQGKKWLELAVTRSNSSSACYNLGILYEQGNGVAIDHNKALGYYIKSAELGELKAYDSVINYFNEGIGIKKNPESANYWVKKKEAFLKTRKQS